MRQKQKCSLIAVIVIEFLRHTSALCVKPKNETGIVTSLRETGIVSYTVPDDNNLTVGAFPVGLERVDAQNKVAVHSVWISTQWVDKRLAWDPNHPLKFPTSPLPFSQDPLLHECVIMDEKEVWVPEIKVVGTIQNIKVTSTETGKVNVQPNGLAQMSFSFSIEESADFDPTPFPFDIAHFVYYVVIRNTFNYKMTSYTDIQDYLDNINVTLPPLNVQASNWDLKSRDCVVDVLDIFPVLKCEMEIKRIPSFHIVNTCLPISVVTGFAVIGAHSASSVEGKTSKFQMGLVALVSLNQITSSNLHQLPQSGMVSYLHIFFLASMGIVISSCVSSWAVMVCCSGKKKVSSRIPDVLSLILHLCAVACLLFWFMNNGLV